MNKLDAYELCWRRSMFEDHRWKLFDDMLDAQASVPGCFVEIGVAQGGVLGYMALTNPHRSLFGYCRFDGGLLHAQPIDGPNLHDGLLGGGPTHGDVEQWLASIGIENVILVPGDICKTLPEKHDAIALAVIDLNLYVPTLHALKWCLAHLSAGGAILVDDATFAGVEQALKEIATPYELNGFMAIIRK